MRGAFFMFLSRLEAGLSHVDPSVVSGGVIPALERSEA